MAILEVVRAVSAVLMQTVPEFWKICRGYREGKYRRVSVPTRCSSGTQAKLPPCIGAEKRNGNE